MHLLDVRKTADHRLTPFAKIEDGRPVYPAEQAALPCGEPGPATRRMAPDTPPPRSRSLFAEFTIASASAVVMSPWIILICVFIEAPLYRVG